MPRRATSVDPIENLIRSPARLAVADLDGARQLFVVAPPSKGLHRHAEKRGEFTSANQCTFSERYVDAINGGGSIYIIEASSLEEATRWAQKIPAGTIEVRPIAD